MDKNMKEIYRLQAESAVRHLKEHNFGATYVETKEEALTFLKENIAEGSTIGVGGSMTLFEAGIIDWLTGNPAYNLLDRYHTDDTDKVFHESLSADVYLMSSNAVLIDGGLYNIDGNGNRIAALIYGPKKVYVIAGVNKLVRNLDEAKVRTSCTAAPMNNARLNIDNPCTKIGTCANCMKDTTICNELLYTRRSGKKERIHVILVNEELGY